MKSYVSKFAVSLIIIFSFSYSSGQLPDNIPLKLKVGTYNVGHFNQGRLGGFQGSGNIVKAELNNWRSWIGMQSIDILSLNEWNFYFDKDSTYDATVELLAPYYSNIRFGKQNTWIYNGIATNYPLRNIEQKNLDGEYYAVSGEIKIGAKIINMISVHVLILNDFADPELIIYRDADKIDARRGTAYIEFEVTGYGFRITGFNDSSVHIQNFNLNPA